MNKKELVAILSVTLIAVAVWVVSDLAHTKAVSQGLPDASKYLAPVDADFDQNTLDKIASLGNPAPLSASGPSVASASASPALSLIATPSPARPSGPLSTGQASPSATSASSASGSSSLR